MRDGLADVKAEMGALRENTQEVKSVLTRVADALDRLARLEERHASMSRAVERAFAAIDALNARVVQIERLQPVHQLTSGWVEKAAWAAAGMIAVIVMKKLGIS